MKKKDVKRILRLLEKQTRAETMARLGPLTTKEGTDYFQLKLKYENKIRKILFGTSDLVRLGKKWGIIKSRKKSKNKT